MGIAWIRRASLHNLHLINKYMNKIEKELNLRMREFLLSANYGAVSAYWYDARAKMSTLEMKELTTKLDE